MARFRNIGDLSEDAQHVISIFENRARSMRPSKNKGAESQDRNRKHPRPVGWLLGHYALAMANAISDPDEYGETATSSRQSAIEKIARLIAPKTTSDLFDADIPSTEGTLDVDMENMTSADHKPLRIWEEPPPTQVTPGEIPEDCTTRAEALVTAFADALGSVNLGSGRQGRSEKGKRGNRGY